MKYYIIAGEASGDLHASNLIKELKIIDQKAVFRCWGGDLMKAQGCDLIKHYNELDYMGFVEVFFNIRTILQNIKFCKTDILSFKPDALILVDYPGFNLRIAEFAKKAGIKVFYYISPQVWAWKQGRVKKIKKAVDRMFVILPFEKDFYKRFNYDVDFVGHPLLDSIANFEANSNNELFFKEHQLDKRPLIAILPGSRKQEVKKMLPVMLAVTKFFPEYQFVIAGVSSLTIEFYNKLSDNKKINVIFGKTYQLLSNAKAAIVTSGTATLETALFEVPEVVCYKGSSISFALAKRLVNIKYISLVNLIMDKEVVKELIQDDFNVKSLKDELFRILNNQKKDEITLEYRELKKLLGNSGASIRTAKLILHDII